MGRAQNRHKAAVGTVSAGVRRSQTKEVTLRECRICGASREATPWVDLNRAGPANLCDQHYDEWFRLYEEEGGVTDAGAYARATERLTVQRV